MEWPWLCENVCVGFLDTDACIENRWFALKRKGETRGRDVVSTAKLLETVEIISFLYQKTNLDPPALIFFLILF